MNTSLGTQEIHSGLNPYGNLSFTITGYSLNQPVEKIGRLPLPMG